MKKLEGTYRLEWRKLPDGSVVKPPEVDGLLTFTKDYRNFNVMWKDKTGKIVSISSAARYRMSGDKYTETNIYYMINDSAGGKGPEYDLSESSGTGRIKSAGDHMEIKLPLHNEPEAVFEGDEMVAVRKDEFEDHWKKVA
jgi:hypothetical protein